MSKDGETHRLKLLAISDTYCPAEFVEQGLAPLADLGVEIEVRRWEHPTLIDLQEANLTATAGFVAAELGDSIAVHLLPYHRLGEAKHERMEQPDKSIDVQPPSGERMEEVRKVFESFGLTVHLGG